MEANGNGQSADRPRGVEPGDERDRGRALRLLAGQEAHRRQMAAALHDEIGQMLAALKLNLASPELASGSADAASLLDESRTLADQLIERLRELTAEVWPAMLDDLGLADATRWYLDRVGSGRGLDTGLESRGLPERLSPELASAGFFVIAEAVDNAVRHASAAKVVVNLVRRRDTLFLEVRDDGAGFRAEAEGESAGGGLRLMRDRVELLGGELEVESTPRRGTRIRAQMPLGTAD